MKVQKIITQGKKRYILLDNNYEVVDAVKRYLKFLDSKGKSPNTLKNYAFHLKTYFEYLDLIGMRYDEIGSSNENRIVDVFSDFVGWLSNGYAYDEKISYLNPPKDKRCAKTVNIIMDVVLGFYDYLAQNKELEWLNVYKTQRSNSLFKGFLYEMSSKNRMIRKNIFHKRETNKRLAYITRAEYKKMLEYCKLQRDKLLLALMFEGGLRIGEALGLHIMDVDVWENRINIVPRDMLENDVRVKNEAEGSLYMPTYVMDLMTAYLLSEADGNITDFLFVNLFGRNSGNAMRPITVNKLFERLSRKIGRKITPHMCRHGHATELHEAGWDLIDIKDCLRHRQIQTTIRYTHTSDEYKRQQIKDFYEKRGLNFE